MTAFRVLYVIPGQAEASMRYVKRQVASLVREGIVAETMHLSSRTNPAALWRAALDLRRRVRAFRPDVIHAHYGTVTALLCAVTSFVPLVITFRGSDLNPAGLGGRWRSRVARLFSQVAALRAARIICVSQQLVSQLWWRRQRATVIPTGVDTRTFQPRPQADARRDLGWSPAETVVLFNASANPVTKGLELATKAFHAAAALRPDLRLYVISGSEPPDRMPLLLNAADCLLVASQHEGSPNIVKEALACNLPVASVDVGDVAERLAGVEPSRLADRTPSELGTALLGVLAARVRSNGLAAVRDLTEERVARRVLSVYREALKMPQTATPDGLRTTSHVPSVTA